MRERFGTESCLSFPNAHVGTAASAVPPSEARWTLHRRLQTEDCGPFKPSFGLSGAVPLLDVSRDVALKGRGFQPRRNLSPPLLCHLERSMSVRRTVKRSREPALSEVEGDPMPVDIQQWPDRESSEISALGCPVVPRTA